MLAATLLPYFCVEGIYSVVRGARAETSLGYSLYADWFINHRRAELDPMDPSTSMITDIGELTAMLPLLKANGFGIGHSPFSALKTEEVSINDERGQCLEQKPNLRKTVGFLRSNLANPFGQMTAFYDADRKLPRELEVFLKRYMFRFVTHSTNEAGERTTLPRVEAQRKVLIAGDSVAAGLMLDDNETPASQLQSHDGSRQYVNLGIARATAADAACALERAARRYRGDIDELIWVLCENDWDPSEKYGRPDALIDWIEAFQKRESIPHVTFLYVPYIYNVVPELVRVRGHSHYDLSTYHDEKHRALERAHMAGFKVIDFLDIAREESDRLGTQFASLSLYVDHAHLSRLGVERLLPRLLGPLPEQRRIVRKTAGTGTDRVAEPNGG